MSELPHVLDLRSMPAATWSTLLEVAEHLAGPAGREPWLRGHRFGMLFFNPSLRTRTAFEVAAFDLGAHAVHLQVGGGLWDLECRPGVIMEGPCAEHVREAIPVLATMVDAIGVRSFAALEDARADAADPILRAIAEASPVPILSLESAMDHPHQGLADALTVRGVHPGRKVRVALTWAPHVKPLPLAVPHAALLAFAREGHEVVLAHPPGYDLDAGVVESARQLADGAGGSLSVTDDQALAAAGADVIYAKSWGATSLYGRQGLGEDVTVHNEWRVDGDTLGRAAEGAVFMHCLPVRRGVVATDEVLDAEASVVVRQAGARLPVQKATLCHAMGVDPREGNPA